MRQTAAAHYRMFGHYNAWANRRLFTVSPQLSGEQYRGDRRIAATIKYRRVSSPEEFEQPLAPALAHWFNHQTHRRGQAHALLTGLLGRAPELDLLFYQRESAKSAVRSHENFTGSCAGL